MLKCESSTGRRPDRSSAGPRPSAPRSASRRQRKTMGPYTGCFSPYGGATLTCIKDPVKGAEAKAAGGDREGVLLEAGRVPRASRPALARTTRAPTRSSQHRNDARRVRPQHLLRREWRRHSVEDRREVRGRPRQGAGEVRRREGQVLRRSARRTPSRERFRRLPASPPATDPGDRGLHLQGSTKAKAQSLDKACFVAPATFPIVLRRLDLEPNSCAGWVNLAETGVDSTSKQVGCGLAEWRVPRRLIAPD